MFISSILPVQDCPLVQCGCADGSGMNYCAGHIPHCMHVSSSWSNSLLLKKCAMATFLLCLSIESTGLLTGMIACLLLGLRLGGLLCRPLETCDASRCSSSLTLALWPKALGHPSFFFVHTALQFWPILSLVVYSTLVRTFLSAHAVASRVHSNWACQDAYLWYFYDRYW